MTDTSAPKEEIEFDKAQLEILRMQNSMLERYEGKIQALLQERLDGTVDEDEYSEQQEELRKVFLRDFEDLYSKVDDSTPEIHFRKILVKATMDQVKRYFAYYTAIVDINSKITQYNMELNDQVLSFDDKDQMQLIRRLEHVKMTTAMAEALEFPADQTKRIIELTIDKCFGVKHT